MTEVKRLLTVRRALKARTPTFIRQEFGKFKKIKAKWTRPKGHHAKMRERRKGNPRMVTVGWRGPTLVRGLHSSGLARIMVSSPAELQRINKQTQGVILSAALGAKKRLVLIADATKQGITILNLRDAQAYTTAVNAKLAERKSAHAAAAKAKEQRKAELEKKAEKAKAKPNIETLTDEEKKKAEKEEKDKVLTQR